MSNKELGPDDFKKKIEDLLGGDKPKYKSGDLRSGKASETDPDVKFATEKALEELETIRQAFLKMQEMIKGLSITEHIKPGIDVVAGSLNGINELILDDIDVDKLSPQGQEDYMQAQRIRAAILAQVYQKYKS